MAKEFHPFKDMKENARLQHEVDKANFRAAKAESKAVWEEAKMSPKACFYGETENRILRNGFFCGSV